MSCLKWSVYKHTSPSGKVYIGITSQTPQIRWANGHGYVGNGYFTKAINKYGWENIQHEIVAKELTKEEAEQMEIALIAKYDSTNRAKGYNISFGGSATVTGLHWKQPPEAIMKRSGVKHWAYGKSPSSEMRQQISNKLRGKPLSEETKRKMRGRVPWNKGRSMSEDEKVRISNALMGHPPPNRKSVRCVETGAVFESATAAMKWAGVTCIYKALHDQERTAGGYHWRYEEGERK